MCAKYRAFVAHLNHRHKKQAKNSAHPKNELSFCDGSRLDTASFFQGFSSYTVLQYRFTGSSIPRERIATAKPESILSNRNLQLDLVRAPLRSGPSPRQKLQALGSAVQRQLHETMENFLVCE